eukprot:7257223-Prymnesium_polylepis.1
MRSAAAKVTARHPSVRSHFASAAFTGSVSGGITSWPPAMAPCRCAHTPGVGVPGVYSCGARREGAGGAEGEG